MYAENILRNYSNQCKIYDRRFPIIPDYYPVIGEVPDHPEWSTVLFGATVETIVRWWLCLNETQEYSRSTFTKKSRKNCSNVFSTGVISVFFGVFSTQHALSLKLLFLSSTAVPNLSYACYFKESQFIHHSIRQTALGNNLLLPTVYVRFGRLFRYIRVWLSTQYISDVVSATVVLIFHYFCTEPKPSSTTAITLNYMQQWPSF